LRRGAFDVDQERETDAEPATNSTRTESTATDLCNEQRALVNAEATENWKAATQFLNLGFARYARCDATSFKQGPRH